MLVHTTFDLSRIFNPDKIGAEASALFKQVYPIRGGKLVDTEDIGVIFIRQIKTRLDLQLLVNH